MKKNIRQEAEEYYIQFWFCENRQMLLMDLRKFYDEAFEIYLKIYKEGRKNHLNLFDIGKKFRYTLIGKK